MSSTKMEQRRLVLFSGMGGDGRLMRPLRVPGIAVCTPDHVEPAPGEDLARYAARVAEVNRIGAADVVGGASFGGMLAAEIARQRAVAGLILLGSCVRPHRLPWAYKWIERLGPFIPDRLLGVRAWRPVVRWRFAPVTAEAERCLRAMAATCPPSQLRGFGRMALTWSGVERLSCPVLSVHGERDRIIPVGCAEPGLVLRDAGHAFTLTHAEPTIAAIQEFLNSRVAA
jgi:pimeloyl-ACP methyl ester carboxylesterase